jgi:hypothetical protein
MSDPLFATGILTTRCGCKREVEVPWGAWEWRVPLKQFFSAGIIRDGAVPELGKPTPYRRFILMRREVKDNGQRAAYYEEFEDVDKQG